MASDKDKLFSKLRIKVDNILDQVDNADNKLQEICDLLQKEVSYYDWVGYYFADRKHAVLNLKVFSGEPTEHITIPFGKGICGQVAVSNQNFIVPDVKAQDNYIACNVSVKSEIVIPLFKNGKNIGQIDIDSHTIDAFSEEDTIFLEWLNRRVSHII